MDKRYQVFISSTFVDLKDERKEIMEAILNLGCFPAGMEMFPASDTEQFEYIKPIIKESDYYILIIAGRYGSVDEDGKSFTEKEYEYARENGIPVLVFVKKDIDNISVSQTDNDPKLREKLLMFRKNVMESRLGSYWDEKNELKYKVYDSLIKAIKTNPRTGWIKGNNLVNTETLVSLEKLRKEKEDLEKEIEVLKNIFREQDELSELAQNEDTLTINYKSYMNTDYPYGDIIVNDTSIEMKWNEIFKICANEIRDGYSMEDSVREELESSIRSKYEKNADYIKIDEDILRTIDYQLEALGLIEIEENVTGDYVYELTRKGKKEYRKLFIVKK